jgi:hypothetical protein
MQHRQRLGAGRPRDRVLGHVVRRGGRRQPRPQAVAGVPSRIQAGRGRRALHRSGDAPIAEPLGQQPTMTVGADAQGRRRAAADAQRQPGAPRPDRARLGARAEGDALQRALARPVGRAPPDRDDQAVGGLLHVADVEGDELAPTEGASEAHEQQRPVPDTDRAGR